jgi:hypothetical protein
MNALPTKTCVDCFVVLAVTDFPIQHSRDTPYRSKACPECTRARHAAAMSRYRARRRAMRRAVEGRPKPFVPPVDFLSMGEADRSAALVWSLGNRLPGPWDRVAA